MNSELNNKQDYDKPVAYDVHGKPLYARPLGHDHQTIHVARPMEPQKVVISDAMMIKHKESRRLFPKLNLSEGEYVINAIRRHPIGLVMPTLLGLVLFMLTIIGLTNIEGISSLISVDLYEGAMFNILIVFLVLFIISIFVGLAISYYVYTRNQFFLTNESVIQEIQTGLFYKHEQTVSLMNIEDASFYKSGLFQQIFDYGTIRLSTEGDETTYIFSYVSNPKRQIAVLNNAVESFKNGRPVED